MRTLNIGTREVRLREIEGLRCRCRRKLAWRDDYEEGIESRIEGREDER